MSTEDEELFIGEVLKMKEQGFETSREETLPALYKQIFGGIYNTDCPSCIRKGFDDLIKWATKKRSTKIQHMAAYKFKHQYKDKSFPIMWKGARIIITSDNLTDERAQILLAVPKYSHVLEATGNAPSITTPVITKQKAAKPEKDQLIEPNLGKAPLITPELEVDNFVPNGKKDQKEPSKSKEDTTSTSKEAAKGEGEQKRKRGRPFAK